MVVLWSCNSIIAPNNCPTMYLRWGCHSKNSRFESPKMLRSGSQRTSIDLSCTGTDQYYSVVLPVFGFAWLLKVWSDNRHLPLYHLRPRLLVPCLDTPMTCRYVFFWKNIVEHAPEMQKCKVSGPKFDLPEFAFWVANDPLPLVPR